MKMEFFQTCFSSRILVFSCDVFSWGITTCLCTFRLMNLQIYTYIYLYIFIKLDLIWRKNNTRPSCMRTNVEEYLFPFFLKIMGVSIKSSWFMEYVWFEPTGCHCPFVWVIGTEIKVFFFLMMALPIDILFSVYFHNSIDSLGNKFWLVLANMIKKLFNMLFFV